MADANKDGKKGEGRGGKGRMLQTSGCAKPSRSRLPQGYP